MTATAAYAKTISGDTAHQFVHNLCLAAIEHGHAPGATMEPTKDAHQGSGGTHTLSLSADSPRDLADLLGQKATELGGHLGFNVEFTDEPARTGPAPVDAPDLTWHLEDPKSGEIVASVSHKQSEPLPAQVAEHFDSVRAYREAQRPQVLAAQLAPRGPDGEVPTLEDFARQLAAAIDRQQQR